MLRLIKLTFATGILAGTYLYTFGIPVQLASLLPISADSEKSQISENSQSGKSITASSVISQPLELTPYTSTVQSLGNSISWQNVDLVSEVSGQIVGMNLEANTYVEAGAKLIELESRSELLNLQMAQAELKQASTLMARYKQILESGLKSISDAELDEAVLAVTQAQIEVDIATVTLDKRTIRSPISGRLGLSELNIGDVVNESDFVVSIDDRSKVIIEFEVPERAFSMLEVGNSVLASTPSYAGRVFDAKISAFDSRLDSITRSVTVRAEVKNPDDTLWSGMTFIVRMLDDSEPMATVPATALNWAQHGAGIWTVENGIAARKPVTVRFRQGGTVWLDTDVAEGTTIVTEGTVKLREGSAVESIPAILSSDDPIPGASPGNSFEPDNDLNNGV